MELPKISQETLLIDRLTQEHQAYPPDLLSFPLRGGTQVSPASGTSSDRPHLNHTMESPAKSPGYGVAAINSGLYSRIQNPNFQGSVPMMSPKGYVTLPRRPRANLPESTRPQVFSTLNGVIPYYDFNMKIFSNGGNYYSLNKSEMDLGPMHKMSQNFQDPDEYEPAPSPAPGTPHATIPRSSLSSPNIHNQLLSLQAMSVNAQGRVPKSEQRPLKVMLAENESLLRNTRDRLGYSVNVVSGTVNRTRTIPNPPPKPRKKNSSDLKEPFLHTVENATQV